MGFEKLTCEQRKAVWRHGLVKYDLGDFLNDEETDDLAASFETSAGGVDVALRHVAGLRQKGIPKEEIIRTMKNVLKAHLTGV